MNLNLVHKHVVYQLINHDKDNRMLRDRSISNAPNALFLSETYFSKTQASLISSFACHTHLENHTETLIRYFQRILKVGSVKVSQIS